MEDIKKTCHSCGKDFLVIVQEQEFLKKMGLPLPKNCPTCRQIKRISLRGERRLYKTTCQKCGKEIIVSFDPKKETRQILCKKCYLDYFEKENILLAESE